MHGQHTCRAGLLPGHTVTCPRHPRKQPIQTVTSLRKTLSSISHGLSWFPTRAPHLRPQLSKLELAKDRKDFEGVRQAVHVREVTETLMSWAKVRQKFSGWEEANPASLNRWSCGLRALTSQTDGQQSCRYPHHPRTRHLAGPTDGLKYLTHYCPMKAFRCPEHLQLQGGNTSNLRGDTHARQPEGTGVTSPAAASPGTHKSCQKQLQRSGADA